MSGSTMFENYTDNARRAVVLAQEESRGMMHDRYIGPEHLLLGLLHADPDAAKTALGDRAEEVRVAILGFASSSPQDSSESLPFTRGCLYAFEEAQRAALALHSDHVGIEHLLMGLLSVHDDRLDRVLVAAGVDRERAQTLLMAALTQG